MQSIRMIHLAHLNKRGDFALGYYLLISAIEPVATSAIKRKAVAPKHELLDQWKEFAKTNTDLKDLFDAYQQAESNNKYIGKRFVEFVMKYCPPNNWYELEHPEENSISYTSEISGDLHDWSWVTKKQWYEIYP